MSKAFLSRTASASLAPMEPFPSTTPSHEWPARCLHRISSSALPMYNPARAFVLSPPSRCPTRKITHSSSTSVQKPLTLLPLLCSSSFPFVLRPHTSSNDESSGLETMSRWSITDKQAFEDVGVVWLCELTVVSTTAWPRDGLIVFDSCMCVLLVRPVRGGGECWSE